MKARPTASSVEVIERQAVRLLKDLGMYADPDSPETEFRLIELTKALEYSTDGFERVYKLTSEYGWAGTEAMVRMMSSMNANADQALREAVTAWVLAEGVRTSVEEGDRVSFRLPGFAKVARGKCIGVLSVLGEVFVSEEKDGSFDGGKVHHVAFENITSRYSPDKKQNLPLFSVRANVGFTQENAEEAVA